MNDRFHLIIHRSRRLLLRTTLFVLALAAIAAALAITGQQLLAHQDRLLAEHADDTRHDWGIEALDALHQEVRALSPLPPANACGLGASSCFRCHNGQRAAAPSTGEAGPWHDQHATVNYSCAGCHKGNPRIIKESIAHKGLVANPLTAPAQTCTGCHAGEATARAQIYLDNHPQPTHGE